MYKKMLVCLSAILFNCGGTNYNLSAKLIDAKNNPGEILQAKTGQTSGDKYTAINELANIVEEVAQKVKPSQKILILPIRGNISAASYYLEIKIEEVLAPTHYPVSFGSLNATLGLEKYKDLLGCDSYECQIEIAGALNVDALLDTSIDTAFETKSVSESQSNAKVLFWVVGIAALAGGGIAGYFGIDLYTKTYDSSLGQLTQKEWAAIAKNKSDSEILLIVSAFSITFGVISCIVGLFL